MFSTMELRLIRNVVSRELKSQKDALDILDHESDDYVEITNDLVLLKQVIEKINEKSDV